MTGEPPPAPKRTLQDVLADLQEACLVDIAGAGPAADEATFEGEALPCGLVYPAPETLTEFIGQLMHVPLRWRLDYCLAVEDVLNA